MRRCVTRALTLMRTGDLAIQGGEMGRKYKPLKIVHRVENRVTSQVGADAYAIALSNLAIAQSHLVQAGKDSAMPHFIAIVKELEEVCGYEFELLDRGEEEGTLPG